jgi:serine phosphatase RsbU (regulator of sigma subunit)
MEKLLKREATEVYEFFASEIPKDENKSRNKFVRALLFLRSLFNAFLLKMSAGRRIFYLAAVLIFLIGFIKLNLIYFLIAFLIINALLAFELADKLTAKDELSLARKIQADLMPKVPPENEYFNISAYYESAREVSGDYYDFVKSPKDDCKTYLVIGDISGKGIAAALYMVRVQAIINYLIKQIDSPKDLIINLKKHFAEKLLPEYFLTIIAGCIDNEGKIRFCRAGHTPLLIYRNTTKEFEEINPKGMGIGLNDKGIFEKTIEEESVETSAGDIVCFYTDGITETMNNHKKEFGIENLKSVIKNNSHLEVDKIKQGVISAVNQFRGNTASHDDLTIILMKAK